MAIARRVNNPPPPPQTGGSVNFGDDSFYTGGLGLPEGDYAVEFSTGMFQPTKADGTPSKTPAFLAVIGTFYPIDKDGNLTGEPQEHPLGCGGDAHDSFLPSADGKGFDAVPNGKKSGLWRLSNWGIFFDSLKNCGLPPGYVTSDLSVMDGVWVHVQNVAEPEEKKAAAKRAKAKTGAAAMMGGQQEEYQDKTVLIVTEILDNGRPWDGTGGIPAVDAAPVQRQAAPRPAARPAARAQAPVAAAPRTAGPRAVARPAPAPVAAATESADDLSAAALAAASAVLGRNPNPTKLQFRTDTFAEVQKTYGDDVAQEVMESFLNTDEMLGALLGELGYAIRGLKVAAAA